MNLLSNRKSAGFTIVETLVAIGILIAVVVAVSRSVQNALSLYIFSKDQVTAFYLAQESFEKLKNMRDNNVINSRNWLSGISQNSSDPCYFGSACTISFSATPVASRCTAPGSCPALYQYQGGGGTQGFYMNLSGAQAGWVQTNIVRQVMLSQISSDEVVATVTVTWSKGGISQQFKIKSTLFNWK